MLFAINVKGNFIFQGEQNVERKIGEKRQVRLC